MALISLKGIAGWFRSSCNLRKLDCMSLQTHIARCVFPRDRTYLAKRKLVQLVWALVVGGVTSLTFVCVSWSIQGHS